MLRFDESFLHILILVFFYMKLIDILDILHKSGLAGSRSEARRNVEQGGVSVDGNAVNDVKAVFTKESLQGEGVVVKRGKKKFVKVIAK